jgi:two-component system chemotaxis response regulator CheY
MDGITMIKKAKEKLGKFSFPVFILTTETNENLKVAGKSIGVMAWIVKPFVQDKVIAAARKVIERAAAA